MDSSLKPQKIILLKPEPDNLTSIEKQIIEITIAGLDYLDSNVKIIYLKERFWINYKKLLYDFNNIENLGNFFALTEVTGVISISIEKKPEKIKVYLAFINLNDNAKITESYELYNSNMIEDIEKYYNFCLNKIESNFPGIDLIKLKNEKIKVKINSRKNPLYEILLSGGLGYYSRQSFGGDIYSLGFTGYINLAVKAQYAGLNIYTEASFLFNNPERLKNKEFFLYNVFTSFDIGFWFLNQTFKIGVGVGISPGSFYKNIYNNNYNSSKMYTFFIFPYLNFSILPIRSIEIILNIGSFISVIQMERILPLFSFPIYLKIIFKYFIYKQLFFEISIPFYMIGYKNNNSDNFNPSFQGMINIGLGWRFEWWKQK